MKIAIISNTAWYLFNFRLNLLYSLKQEGHTLILIVPKDSYSHKLIEKGFIIKNIFLDGSSINPIKEFYSLFNISYLLYKNKFDLVLSFTPKVNIYSAISSILFKIPFIPSVSGLGRVFINQNLLTHLVIFLYKLTFHKSLGVFFENLDDKNLFVSLNIISKNITIHVPGTGIDLNYFSQYYLEKKLDNLSLTNLNKNIDSLSFLLIARILWDKGVGEYVSSARIIRKSYPNIRFKILGFLDAANPSAISRDVFFEWVEEGVIDYLGQSDDVRPYILDSDCVVLPSYREGLPRSLLEAASMSRPVITTNVPGCKDTIIDGKTGFLCKSSCVDDLVFTIEKFISLSKEDKFNMGINARNFMINSFDENIVINKYLTFINSKFL